MSFETITINRDFAITNGYVQVPPNEEGDKTRVTEDAALTRIAGAVVISLSLGSGKLTGSKHGAQRLLRLPGLQPGDSYSTDPVTSLADA